MGLFTKDIETMDDLLIHGLQDIYYAENQIVEALPKLIDKATNRDLSKGLTDHLEETKKQIGRLDQVFKKLGKEGGMLGMSGVSPDMRDVERAAAEGNARAKLALDAFVESVRGFIGQYLVALNGCDVLAFTGGIGENGIAIRGAICRGMEWAGISLDPAKNGVRGKEERISKVESGAEIWVIPTNEELIVARQTEAVLNAN